MPGRHPIKEKNVERKPQSSKREKKRPSKIWMAIVLGQILLSLTETFEVKDFLRFLAICGLGGQRMGGEWLLERAPLFATGAPDNSSFYAAAGAWAILADLQRR
jgi:hypothetical protein